MLKINTLDGGDTANGMYQCTASNLGGSLTFTKVITTDWLTIVLQNLFGRFLLLAIAVASIVFICLITTVLYLFKKQKVRGNQGIKFLTILWSGFQLVREQISQEEIKRFLYGDHNYQQGSLSGEEQAYLLPYDEDIEFPKQRLVFGREIGSGAFGRVVIAQAVGILPSEDETTVAVKMVKPPVDKSQLLDLMKEIKIMQHIGRHLNVISLLGACTTGIQKRELFVIVEYCCYGNLQKLLQNNRKWFLNQIDEFTGAFDPNERLSRARALARSSAVPDK